MNELLCSGKLTFFPQCARCVYVSASRMREGHIYNVIIIGAEQSTKNFLPEQSANVFSAKFSFCTKPRRFFAIRCLCASFVHSWTVRTEGISADTLCVCTVQCQNNWIGAIRKCFLCEILILYQNVKYFAIRYLCASFLNSWTFIAFCTCSLHCLEVHVC